VLLSRFFQVLPNEDTFPMDIQNIILYDVEFKYYPYVYAYTHAIWSWKTIWEYYAINIHYVNIVWIKKNWECTDSDSTLM
jgi:hypothetical protein